MGEDSRPVGRLLKTQPEVTVGIEIGGVSRDNPKRTRPTEHP
jgi:hypothetical protein